ncbi:MAG: glutamate racemase [Steroidobacteraceae bacterium]
MTSKDRPVGVFDSGIGGLTVLRALRGTLPAESFVYLGDTARLPYGTKTAATVERYALQAASLLVERGIKCLVIACNTASAAALPAIKARYPRLPVIGVVAPGAAAACAVTRNGHVAVIATEGTVRGGAYEQAIRLLRPDIRVTAIATQLFVALAEEGWTTGEAATLTARRYLAPAFAVEAPPDTLVLGCTHFPLLRGAIAGVVGARVQIVDSALTTALVCREELITRGLLGEAGAAVSLDLLATDGAERFARVGSEFLGMPIDSADIERVDLAPVA